MVPNDVGTNSVPPIVPEVSAEDEAKAAEKKAKLEAHLALVKAKLQETSDPNVVFKESSFFFKTDKELGIKRDTVTLALPFPTAEGILNIVSNGGKELDLLLEAAADVVLLQARELVNADENITQDTIDLSKLSWNYIANMPKAARRGGGIAQEVWEEFSKDYIAIMPAITGKKLENVQNAAKLFLAKFNPCKTNKKVLAVLKAQLSLWYTNTKQAEEFKAVFEFLDGKAETLLKADDAALLDTL